MAFLTRAKGFWDDVLSQARVTWFEPRTYRIGTDLQRSGGWGDDEVASRVSVAMGIARDMSPADMYRFQPSLRNVVSFIARNIAQVRVHVYEVVNENDRRRRRDSKAARVLRNPNPQTTGYQLMYGLVADRKLYDVAYLILSWDGGNPQLYRVPPPWVERKANDPFMVDHYLVTTSKGQVKVPVESMIEFRGYDPVSNIAVSPAIAALREVLSEQVAATVYRSQVWRNGGRISSVLKRPLGAPKWSPEAQARFKRDWKEKWTGNGPEAGGTPILEEGMELQKIDFSAKEQEWVEGVKLGLSIVAATYHVNPTMVGLLDNANYSNVREFRKMLYGDTLGPDFEDIQEILNAQLLPRLGEADLYAEFNTMAKLQGNFEEQAQYLQSATGAAYMTRNEARARLNLPAIEGGDELVVPLNVLEGGQASPSDSDPSKGFELPDRVVKSLGGPTALGEVFLKSASSAKIRDQYHKTLQSYFHRQRNVVLSRMGAKKSVWWDQARWNRELAEDLFGLHTRASTDAAKRALSKANKDTAGFNQEQTLAYWDKVAKAQAIRINRATKEKLDETLDDESGSAEHVFDIAEGSRSDKMAVSLATAALAWGVLEAGRQTGAKTKTWVVTSGNPRSSHASMNGETVKMNEQFSNGLAWPGDGASGDADELAGCQCELQINYEDD